MTTKKNVSKIEATMTFMGSPCWIIYSDEHSDPYFAQFVTPKTIVPSIAVLSPKKSFLIVNALDADNVEEDKGLRVIRYKNESEMWEIMGSVIEQLNYPSIISLNYSTMGDAQVDVLGYGMYRVLSKKLKGIYPTGKKFQISSAEELIYALSDRKSDGDIAKMKVAARRALEILESTFSKLKPGMTEIDAVRLVHSIFQKKPDYFGAMGVTSEDLAWEKDMCPIVLTGPSFTKGGHALPSTTVIKEGQTVYFDFGVQLTFKDGSKWSSDIQRMGYMLRRGEKQEPPEVTRMFITIVESIQKGMTAIKPGMRGYEVDKVVRDYVRKAGYPDYDHATGHAIGQLSHSPGALLGPRHRKLSKLKIQPNGVYSLEPRIPIVNGGSIEEMVVVTSEGGKPLCPAQESLYLVACE